MWHYSGQCNYLKESNTNFTANSWNKIIWETTQTSFLKKTVQWLSCEICTFMEWCLNCWHSLGQLVSSTFQDERLKKDSLCDTVKHFFHSSMVYLGFKCFINLFLLGHKKLQAKQRGLLCNFRCSFHECHKEHTPISYYSF